MNTVFEFAFISLYLSISSPQKSVDIRAQCRFAGLVFFPFFFFIFFFFFFFVGGSTLVARLADALARLLI